MANHRAKWTKIWASGGSIKYLEYFWFSVQVQFGVIRYIYNFSGDLVSRKLVQQSNMDNNCNFKGKSLVPEDYVSLLSVQGQFWSFSVFPVLNDLVSIF